jgi:hypothetical protein
VNNVAGLCTVASVVLTLGFGTLARAQNIEILPPDAPPPTRRSPAPAEAPPEVTPATPPEAGPGAPPDATAATPEAPAAAPADAQAAAVAAPAAVAAFGEAWHYVISLERALGYDHISQTQSFYGQDSRTTSTNFSLFGPPAGALAAFSFPRVALDLFVASNFSVGIGLGLLHGSTSVTPSGGTSTEQSFIGVLAAPRVGYTLNLAPDIALWARGGVSVVYLKVDPAGAYISGSAASHLVAATIELPFVFTVLPRIALVAGPTLDITFDGHLSRPALGDGGVPSYDVSVTEIGLQGGALVYF